MSAADFDDVALPGALVRRKGTPALVADLLREEITAGKLRPGTRLPVERLSKSLRVSANTVREALQLLERERLVTQHLNRGIFISELGAEDVTDLYVMRRCLELGILQSVTRVPEESLDALKQAVELGERALEDEDWAAAGSSTTEFHTALVAIAGSKRVTTSMRQLMAELRLLMSPLKDHVDIHRHFIARHRQILEHLTAGELDKAKDALADYLDAGERALLSLFGDD